MFNLSRSQLHYIAAIDALKPIGATQTTISEFLDVKRPSVHAAMKTLMAKGYVKIIRKEEKTITYGLTENGLAALEHLKREKKIFYTFFRDYIGMSEDLVDDAYDKSSLVFDKFMLDDLAEFCENGFQKLNRTEEERIQRSAFGQYEYGTYTIPFRVHKFDGSSTSMGDKGFIHPATIILNKTEQILCLKAKKLYYRPGDGRGMRGNLSALNYYSNNQWHTAEIQDENTYIIPLKRIPCISNELGQLETGQIKIQAESSCKHMPVSIADIILDFNQMEMVEEAKD